MAECTHWINNIIFHWAKFLGVGKVSHPVHIRSYFFEVAHAPAYRVFLFYCNYFQEFRILDNVNGISWNEE